MTAAELIILATQIRNEANEEANTAERLGLLLIGIIDSMQNNVDLNTLQMALNAKANAMHTHSILEVAELQNLLDSKSNVTHTHAITDTTGLQTALDEKANISHSHTIAEVANLQTTLNGKATVTHTHAIADTTGLQTALDGKANSSHTHSISQITSLQTTLNAKANTNHTHTIENITDLQTTLDAKAEVVHTHQISEVINLESALYELNYRLTESDALLPRYEEVSSPNIVNEETSVLGSLLRMYVIPNIIGAINIVYDFPEQRQNGAPAGQTIHFYVKTTDQTEITLTMRSISGIAIGIPLSTKATIFTGLATNTSYKIAAEILVKSFGGGFIAHATIIPYQKLLDQ